MDVNQGHKRSLSRPSPLLKLEHLPCKQTVSKWNHKNRRVDLPTKADSDNLMLLTEVAVDVEIVVEAKVVLPLMKEPKKEVKSKVKVATVVVANAVAEEAEVKAVKIAEEMENVALEEMENVAEEEMVNVAEVAEEPTDPEMKMVNLIVLNTEPEKLKNRDSLENLESNTTLWTNNQELDVANATKERPVVVLANGETARMTTKKPKK